MTHEDFLAWSNDAAIKRDNMEELYKENPSEELLREFKDYLENK